MILCEQCGNEFGWGKIVERDNKKYVKCPYCGNHNKYIPKKRKKKGRNYNGSK